MDYLQVLHDCFDKFLFLSLSAGNLLDVKLEIQLFLDNLSAYYAFIPIFKQDMLHFRYICFCLIYATQLTELMYLFSLLNCKP